MEGNKTYGPRKLKFSENVTSLEDEDEENGAAAIPKIAGKGDEEKWTNKDREEFYQLGDIQTLRTKHVEPDQDKEKDFISVSKRISHASKTKLLRYLESGKMPFTGTHGYVRYTGICNPLNGKYAEGEQFTKIMKYAASSTRRVNKCVDSSTNEAFIRKEIRKTEWNKNEAIIPTQLEHKNIAAVIGVIQRNQLDGLWVELLLKDAGTSLEDFLRARFPLSMKVFLDICDQGLVGLRHIHQHGIAHQDVKPANFVIDAGLNVRLTDFGSSRLQYEEVSVTGGWTPEYLAPECAKYLLAIKEKRSEPDLSRQITTKVDVFSFAIVMEYLVTGKHLLIGLVTPDCEYENGQRDMLRENLIQQIIENPEGIRELISRTTNDERLKALLCAMSCEDVEKRYSAKDALVKVTELRQTEHPTHPKTTDKVMVEELNENAVYSATKLKYRGLALQHPRIRAQESAHRLDGSRKANAVEMSQQKQSDVQTSSKLKKKGPGLEFTSVKRTANVRQVNELRQAGALLSEGSTALPPKHRKTNEPGSGEDAKLFQEPYSQSISIHNRPENDNKHKHENVRQGLKATVIKRQQQKEEPATSCVHKRLRSDLDCIPTVDLIYYDSSKIRTAAGAMGASGGGLENGNCNNGGMNNETGAERLPCLDVLRSSDSFKE